MSLIQSPTKVLIAEDERATVRELEYVLAACGYEVITARDGLTAWNILKDVNTPRLAILDWMMPGMEGIDICRRLRQLRREPYTYLILLTEKTSREDLIAGMNAGADDYISKPFHAGELDVRLRAGQRVLSLIDETIAAREILRHRAMHDCVTGLLNHASICESLNRELNRAIGSGQPLGAIMLDLDHFKRVNDTYGHIAGDIVLAEVGNRIRQQIGRQGVAGRYGGEEFLVILPGSTAESAFQIAGSLRDAIGWPAIDTPVGRIPITASIGAAVSTGAQMMKTDELITLADAALYAAKKSGRNSVQFAPAVSSTALEDAPADAALIRAEQLARMGF